MSHTDVLFRELHSDELPDIMKIESLCVNCFENGETKLLLIKIPFFRDVIISSFECEHCNYQNRNIDANAVIQAKGVKITLKIVSKTDLNRRMVRSKTSIFNIPHLEASFPIQEGALTTIEGSIQTIIENIESLQDERRIAQPELAHQLDEFIDKLRRLLNTDDEFIVELIDPTGNSVIENLIAPRTDPQMTIEHYKRSQEENLALAINEDAFPEDESVDNKNYVQEAQDEFNPKNEVLIFQLNCPECNYLIEGRMKVLDIPHFKEVIVMASNCENCGFKENEVKGGCGIAEKGRRITLKIDTADDLTRDFLKSDTAGIRIPELDVETECGTLGGRFTTVEGILRQMADKLLETNPFLHGDSANEDDRSAILCNLIKSLQDVASGKKFGVTLIIEDPAGGSYIQDIFTPEIDPRLIVEDYERSFQENEDLGLNDMRTTDYISQ